MAIVRFGSQPGFMPPTDGLPSPASMAASSAASSALTASGLEPLRLRARSDRTEGKA